MDTHNINATGPNPPATSPSPTPNLRPAQNPITPSKSTLFFHKLYVHKKIILTVFAIILLLGVVFYLSFSAIKDRFFPGNGSPGDQLFGTNPGATLSNTSIFLTSPKISYSVSEKIPVSVQATAGEAAITAFDVVIEYDPEFLTLSKRNTPPLQEFTYYGQNTDTLISVSAIQKPDSERRVKFDKTTLFDLEFTPKKAGKTVLKVIYSPSSTSESNLLNPESKDILGNVRALEVIITQ